MTLQNRVLPTGEIRAIPAWGTFMGNRGILHNDDKTLGASRWKTKGWVTCVLSFKDRPKRELMAEGRYTELFFLDEAVALAAGHRPCSECRHDAYLAWREAWTKATGTRAFAPDMDACLHKARVRRDRSQVRHAAVADSLPEGAFLLWQDRPHLVTARGIHPYSPEGYGAPLTRPEGTVTVLTPEPTIAVLRHGFRPELHQSATGPAS